MADEDVRRTDLIIIVVLMAFVLLAKMVIDYWLALRGS